MWIARKDHERLLQDRRDAQSRIEGLLEANAELRSEIAQLRRALTATTESLPGRVMGPDVIFGVPNDPFAVDEAELSRIRQAMLKHPLQTLWQEGGGASATLPAPEPAE